MVAVEKALGSWPDAEGVLSPSRQLQGVDIRFFYSSSRSSSFNKMLEEHYELASPPWLAAVEAVEALDNAFCQDTSLPGGTLAQELCLNRLGEQTAAGDQGGRRGLRAALVKRLTEHYARSRSEDLAKQAGHLILPDEESATPAASRRSVEVASDLFNSIVSLLQLAGNVWDVFATPLWCSFRAATAPHRSREALDLSALLRLMSADLDNGCRYSDEAVQAHLRLLKRAASAGVLVAGEPGSSELPKLAASCVARLAAMAGTDSDDIALDAIAAVSGVSSESGGKEGSDAWFLAQKSRDEDALLRGSLPPTLERAACGGATRRRILRGVRGAAEDYRGGGPSKPPQSHSRSGLR